MKAFDLIFHLLYIFIQFLHSTSFKTDTENNFDLFSATFSPISIIKGLISYIFNIDIWSKWLLDELIISLDNFKRKKIFNFLKNFSF